MAVVQDVAAPLYARALVEAAKKLGPSPAYYALWPSTDVAQPWSKLAARLYNEVASHMFHSEACKCVAGHDHDHLH